MYARLVSYSQPVNRQSLTADNVKELIAYCARVSNPANQMNVETSDRLLKYLIKHKHWSPFEMASACLEIRCPRDISRQLLRHRSFSAQEFSQRYAALDANAFTIREARLQDEKNRQNSIITTDKVLKKEWEARQQRIIDEAYVSYEWALENGIAKECARVILPEGNTMSTLFVNGTIRSWIHYIEVRTDESTQFEHRELAKAVSEAITKIFPM